MKQFAHVFLVGLILACATSARGESIEWIRQFGTTDLDNGRDVSADGLGNVYIAGYTEGSLGGPYAGGLLDAFVSKYDAAGGLFWSRQLGSKDWDEGTSVSADGLGNVYLSGNTDVKLGDANVPNYDAFVSKFDADGSLLWTRQLGTTEFDSSVGVSADGLGNIYLSGYTSGSLGGPNAGAFDAFVSKFDAEGGVLWTRQLGTTGSDFSHGVSADGLGNVYISGQTNGSLGGPNGGDFDAFVSKYDEGGSLLWTRQLHATSWEASHGVSADGLGNVYISGLTDGIIATTFTDGIYATTITGDAFVSKYDAAGDLLWMRQLGTTSFDYSLGVSADGVGNVYISGFTEGSLGGPNAGERDAFVSKYDDAGSLLWTRQLGTTGYEHGFGVSADGLGNVYLSGDTGGSLGGPNAGRLDAFVAKIADGVVPEPSSLTLSAVSVLGLFVGVRRRWGKTLTRSIARDLSSPRRVFDRRAR
jgi:hypothetical protein